MSATIVHDRTAGLTTIVIGSTLNAADRISLMDQIDDNIRELEASNILLDIRLLGDSDLPGVKNLVVQLGFRSFRMIALVGGGSHDETLRRIVQWFPFSNPMNVFSSPESALEWLCLQVPGFQMPHSVADIRRS